MYFILFLIKSDILFAHSRIQFQDLLLQLCIYQMAFDGQLLCFIQFLFIMVDFLRLLLYQLILVVNLSQHISHLLVGFLLSLFDDIIIQILKFLGLFFHHIQFILQLGLFMVQICNHLFLLGQDLVLCFILIDLEVQQRKLIEFVADEGNFAAELCQEFFNLNI